MNCKLHDDERPANPGPDGTNGLEAASETDTGASTPMPIPRDPDERVTTRNLLRKLEAQGYCCLLTGWQLTPETAGVDHLAPVSQGGQHAMSNIAIVDSRVNRAKGTLPLEEFIQLCVAVADWNRSKVQGGAS